MSRKDFWPKRRGSLVGIDHNDTAQGRILRGQEVEPVPLRADKVVEGIPRVEQRLHLRFVFAQIQNADRILLVSIEQRDDQVASVVGHMPAGYPRRMICHLVDELVLILWI